VPGLRAAPVTVPVPAAARARLRRRGFLLEYASIAWMTAEAAVAITAGIIASSIALTGFGLDSVIELAAAIIVVWQLRGDGEERETRAVRLIGVTFFALAAYLAIEGIRDLAGHARPAGSPAGLAIAAAALVVMPALALAKRRTGQALGNQALIADSAETAFCALTSAATLAGTGLNAWAGWWWADPAAGLIIAALAAREGLQAWQDNLCPFAETRPPSRNGLSFPGSSLDDAGNRQPAERTGTATGN
jgi:divalent metal cation (Fe/Co/Zn/Cd) transporter